MSENQYYPTLTDVDAVRLIIADTDKTEYTDEQIEGFLEIAWDNIGQACVLALRNLTTRYSVSGGEEYRLDTISYKTNSSKGKYFKDLLDRLIDDINNGVSPLSVGQIRTYGIYVSDRIWNYKMMLDKQIIYPRYTDFEDDYRRRTQSYGPYNP